MAAASKKLKYPIEELLRIRETTKEVAEAVRRISHSELGDHLLRNPSNGPTFRDRKLRSSSVITDHYEDAPSDELEYRNSKPMTRSIKVGKWGASPTASLRRGKAELLLKEHGSPPGIRVTAGGRIVPDTLSPLASPRFDNYKTIARHLNFGGPAPIYGPPRGQNGGFMDNGEGTYGAYMHGEYLSDNRGPMNMMHVFMPPANVQHPPGMLPYGAVPIQAFPPHFAAPQPFLPPGFGPPQFQPGMLPTEREVRLMEGHHSQLEQELKDLNKNEVLQRSSLTAKKREEIVKKRVELTQRLDDSRIAINAAKKTLEQMGMNGQQHPANGMGVFISPQQMHPSPILPTFNPVHEQFQPVMNEVNNFTVNSQRSFSGQTFQPNMPEFVPKLFKPTGAKNDLAPPTSAALQERTTNVLLGANKGDHSSIETAKGFGTDGMGLDGSVHHPRRSHAVAIKDPKDHSTKDLHSLDPSSPAYKPKNGAAVAIDNDSSPCAAVRSDKFALAHHQIGHNEHSSPNQSTQHSEVSTKSAETADFFPGNTHEYSQHRTNVGHMKHPSWMPKEGDPELEPQKPTPVARLPNKFVFPDDSPAERYYSTISSPVDSPMAGYDESPNHGRIPIALGSPMSSTKTQAYWDGFNAGVQLIVMPANTTEEFRVGYRDAVYQSRSNGGASSGFVSAPVHESCSQTGDVTVKGISRDIKGSAHSVTKSHSFPTFNTFANPTTGMPEVPANSLATTPTRTQSAKRMNSSGTVEKTPKSSSTSAFESDAIVDVEVMSVDVASPSINQPNQPYQDESAIGNVDRDQASQAGLSYVSAKLKDRGSVMDQQRYVQSGTSTVYTSNQHAQGVFQPQYDGSNTEEETTIVPMSPVIEPIRPTTPTRKVVGSPVRRKASAAVAAMMEAAGIGSRSPVKSCQEFSKPGSPEKKQWREKFAKGFRGNKFDTVVD